MEESMKNTVRFLVVAALALTLCASAASAAMVTFQVNMKFQMSLGNFNPAVDSLFVRGSFQGWAGYGNRLTDANNDSIYTGQWDIAAGAIEYKFVNCRGGSDTWENVDNRTLTVGTDPIVVPVVWFNNQEPVSTENVEVNFRVNMTIQTLTGNFAPATDWIVVRGGNDSLGNWGGAVRLTEETGNPGVYSRMIRFPNLAQGTAVQYKFVYLTNGDPAQAHWESNDNRTFTPNGTEPDVLPPPNGNGFHEILPEMVYFSNVGPNDIITNDLNVIFQVDCRPLYGALRDVGYVTDVQTRTDTVRTVVDIDAAGFFNSWPWGQFLDQYKMNDLGQNGDLVAGDSIWSRSILFAAGSPRELIYKFGVNGYDCEARATFNHSQILDDAQSTFRIPTICWGVQDTLFNVWQARCTASDADEQPVVAPNAYRLDQNYPNPFNPVTNITFALPKEDLASVRVYDITGREVATLLNGKLAAGEHTVAFDASTLATGMYFYRLEAGSFTATRKLLLLK
jgi:hypothetical protein